MIQEDPGYLPSIMQIPTVILVNEDRTVTLPLTNDDETPAVFWVDTYCGVDLSPGGACVVTLKPHTLEDLP